MKITKGNIRVEFVRLGEGYEGDYNPDDPDDEELYRFDVSYKHNGKWHEIPDASYCTAMPVKTEKAILRKALTLIADEYYNACSGRYIPGSSPSVKRMGESLSWLNPADFEIEASRDPS